MYMLQHVSIDYWTGLAGLVMLTLRDSTVYTCLLYNTCAYQCLK